MCQVTYNMTLILLFLVIDTFLMYFSDVHSTMLPPPPPEPYDTGYGGQKAKGKGMSFFNFTFRTTYPLIIFERIGKRRNPVVQPPPPPPPPEDWPQIDQMPYDGVPPHLHHRCPPTLQAVAKNGLAYFLIANLLTGLVNLQYSPNTAEDGVALAVLVGYMATLHLVAVIANIFGWTFKYW